ncbi:hypothetical protein F5146DRAFT_16597 [Armillaria mellea]|nr:hypothetical protein F5146DRAFT_16597 [Armillaria mellea]
MLDDMAVLVPSTIPDNVNNLTFNSFGLSAQCEPVVDCSVQYLSSYESAFYCPSFNPPYNVSGSSIGDSRIDMLNLTSNALSPDPQGAGFPLDSVLNPFGARVILYWDIYFDDGFRFFPGLYRVKHSDVYVGTCNMTAYDITLSYRYSRRK